jgi:hypothetical protein
MFVEWNCLSTTFLSSEHLKFKSLYRVTLDLNLYCLQIHSIYFPPPWLFQPIQGPVLLFSSVIIFSQMVGLPRRVISLSQGRYLNTGQHKHRINAYTHQTSIPWVGFETRSQHPSERREFILQTAWLLWPAHIYIYIYMAVFCVPHGIKHY